MQCLYASWVNRIFETRGIGVTLWIFTIPYPVMHCNVHGCRPARCRHIPPAVAGLFTLISLQLPQCQSQPIITPCTYHTTTLTHTHTHNWAHMWQVSCHHRFIFIHSWILDMARQGKPDYKGADWGSVGFFRCRILCHTIILVDPILHVRDNTVSSNLAPYQRNHQITALWPGHVDTLHTWPLFFGEQMLLFFFKGNRKQCDQEQKQGSNREKVREKRRKSTATARQFSVIRCYSGEFGETFLWDWQFGMARAPAASRGKTLPVHTQHKFSQLYCVLVGLDHCISACPESSHRFLSSELTAYINLQNILNNIQVKN